MSGILGYGVYIPRLRIKKGEIAKVWGGGAPGIKEKSVPDIDEDSTTMAVEAAKNAIKHAGIDPLDIGALYIGSTSSPYVEKSMGVIVEEALDMSPNAIIADFGGSPRASTAALRACMDAIDAKRISCGLVIGTDFRLGAPGEALEHSLGAGAGALILGTDGVIAEIEGICSYSTSFTSTWKVEGETFIRRHDDPRLDRAYGYPPHIVEAVRGLMENLGRKPADFNQVVFCQPDGRLPAIPAKSLGINPELMVNSSIVSFCGDTGSSSVLIGLAAILDQAKSGEKILAASYGSGAGSDAFSIITSDSIEKKRDRLTPVRAYLERKEYIDYCQYEKIVGILKVRLLPEPMSSFGALPEMARDLKYIIRLRGLKCKKCGSLNFPKRHFCIDCRGEDFEEVKLPRCGRIATFNFQYVVAVEPETAPIGICYIRLEGAEGEYGGKIAAMMTECKPDEVKVGTPVELIFRRCGQELGLVKYGYKARPIKE